ncbi:MAG: TrmH family RNA methyltransferase [Nocardioidaceae bacterium]
MDQDPWADAEHVAFAHPEVKRARDLLRGSGADTSTGPYVAVDTIWGHEAVLAERLRPQLLLVAPEALRDERARAVAAEVAAVSALVLVLSTRTMQRVANRDRPDGLVCVVTHPVWDPATLPVDGASVLLVADRVESPGNLGTLLRTLDGCGGAALVVTDRRASPRSPKAFNASHGMSLSVPQLDFATAGGAAAWLSSRGFTTYLAEPEGAVGYREPTYAGPTAFVLGSERYGVSADWRALDLPRVVLPMLGRADSLNVSIAGAVLLYEARARKSERA